MSVLIVFSCSLAFVTTVYMVYTLVEHRKFKRKYLKGGRK